MNVDIVSLLMSLATAIHTRMTCVRLSIFNPRIDPADQMVTQVHLVTVNGKVYGVANDTWALHYDALVPQGDWEMDGIPVLDEVLQRVSDPTHMTCVVDNIRFLRMDSPLTTEEEAFLVSTGATV